MVECERKAEIDTQSLGSHLVCRYYIYIILSFTFVYFSVPTKPIKINKVDLKVSENVRDHHTEMYELTEKIGERKPQLVQ